MVVRLSIEQDRLEYSPREYYGDRRHETETPKKRLHVLVLTVADGSRSILVSADAIAIAPAPIAPVRAT